MVAIELGGALSANSHEGQQLQVNPSAIDELSLMQYTLGFKAKLVVKGDGRSVIGVNAEDEASQVQVAPTIIDG
jgi:hypothetical protein